MAERIPGTRGEHDLINQLRADQRFEIRIVRDSKQMCLVEPQSDHGCCIQCQLRRWPQPVDSRRNGRLKRGGHFNISGPVRARTVSTLAIQDASIGEVADDLLGEEGIARSTLGDSSRQLGDGGMSAQ